MITDVEAILQGIGVDSVGHHVTALSALDVRRLAPFREPVFWEKRSEKKSQLHAEP